MFWILFLSLVLTGGYFINSVYFATRYTDSEKYSFSVSSGMTIRDVAGILEKDGIVNSQNSIILQNQFNPVDNLQVGDYELKLPSSPADIILQILDNSNKISKINKENLISGTTVLIKEGTSVDQIASILEKEIGLSKAVFTSYVQPYSESLKSKYTFLPNDLGCQYGDINTCPKYYLEGYLYPDTYTFQDGLSVEGIVGKFLDNFEKKVVKKLPENRTSLDFNQIIVLASLVEKETGRPINGVNSTNIDQLKEERSGVARVFINRINQGIKLSSDPTIGYWSGKTVCQQTLIIEDCIGINDENVNHVLNTYRITGLPPAPITSPQAEVIFATLNPSQSDNLFFVSDKFGLKYFAVDYNEHLNNIAKVQIINNN